MPSTPEGISPDNANGRISNATHNAEKNLWGVRRCGDRAQRRSGTVAPLSLLCNYPAKQHSGKVKVLPRAFRCHNSAVALLLLNIDATHDVLAVWSWFSGVGVGFEFPRYGVWVGQM